MCLKLPSLSHTLNSSIQAGDWQLLGRCVSAQFWHGLRTGLGHFAKSTASAACLSVYLCCLLYRVSASVLWRALVLSRGFYHFLTRDFHCSLQGRTTVATCII